MGSGWPVVSTEADLTVTPPPAASLPTLDAAAGEERFTRFLARRFVRARRQGFVSLISAISALGFALGVASLIIALALMTGFTKETFRQILEANAHVWILSADDGQGLADPDALAQRLSTLPGVAAAEPLVVGEGGLLAPGVPFQFTQVYGVEAAHAGQVTSIGRSMVVGELADLEHERPSGRPGVILGEKLARRCGVQRGDSVRLITPSPDIAPWGATLRPRTFEVIGIFSTGYEEYDKLWSVISLRDAQAMFGARGRADRVAVRVTALDRIPQTAQSLRQQLGTGYQVEDISEIYRPLFSALRLEKLLMFLAIGLIVLVAAFGVVSTLVLSVMQKVRAIGVLAAMGATPRGLMRIFVYQGAAVGVVGTIAGAGLGVGACWLLDHFELIKLDQTVYYIDHLPFELLWHDVATVVGVSLLVAVLATVYPAWKVAQLDPIEALRHD